MKKRYEVTAEYSKVMKQFEIYTSNAQRVASQDRLVKTYFIQIK